MSILLIVVALTVTISALCSLSEAALYSTRLGALDAARASGVHKKTAERFIEMKKNIARPTAAILILNTFANTAGAAVAGVYAARVLGPANLPVFTIALTLLILFLAEILPKTYGAVHWRGLWPYLVMPLTLVEKLLSPLIRLSWAFSSLFTGRQSPAPVTEEEIMGSIRLGAETGHVTSSELYLLRAVFHFDELVCRQIMVPRRDVVFFEIDWPLAECLALAERTKHTRYPVCRDSLDDLVGVAHIKDLVGLPPDGPFNLEAMMRPARRVPESMPINRLLREMQRTRQHMAVVIDEHGTATGIVTLENVLEQIVGAVQDEFDIEEPEIVPDGTGRFLVSGSLSLEKVNRALKLELSAPNTDTLSGLIVAALGRLPKEGDTADLEGIGAEILEVESGTASRVRLILPNN